MKMRQRILNHTSILIIISVVLTFTAAGAVMFHKGEMYMEQGVRDETVYIQIGIEEKGNSFLTDEVGKATESRITLLKRDGSVIYDSEKNEKKLENHSNRPEFIEAQKKGRSEMIRYSSTLSRQTFYYAVKLNSGDVLRVSRTMDSLPGTLASGFTLLGILAAAILFLELFLVQKQTEKIIEPINRIDLEHPLENVCYNELRPLLGRIDQQNRQIDSQMEELKNAENMRKEFSANVSHELKTPLMSISGYAELMMNHMVPADKVPEFSSRIYQESKRLSSLVADIIQLSRLDEDRGDVLFEEADLHELGEEVTGNLKEQAEKKQITLKFQGETAGVRGVRHVLYEMLYNITDNAIRYTPQGGKVTVSVGKRNGKPYFCVEDNGIGIPKNEQERIFERFYRVDKSHSRETGGTGLGLSIVKHGASLHNAKIHLDSEPGRGTKMEIIFR